MAEFYVQSMDWPVWNKLLKKNVVKSIKFPEIRYNEDFFTVFQWLYMPAKLYILISRYIIIGFYEKEVSQKTGILF